MGAQVKRVCVWAAGVIVLGVRVPEWPVSARECGAAANKCGTAASKCGAAALECHASASEHLLSAPERTMIMGEQCSPRADGDFATWAEQHFESVEKFWSVKRGQPQRSD